MLQTRTLRFTFRDLRVSKCFSTTQDGTLTDFFTAFSRENALKKVYVQNLMIEQSDLIYELVCNVRNGYFYVCGATTMGNDVYKTLEKVLVDRGVGDVSTYLSAMKESGRYVQELWS